MATKQKMTLAELAGRVKKNLGLVDQCNHRQRKARLAVGRDCSRAKKLCHDEGKSWSEWSRDAVNLGQQVADKLILIYQAHSGTGPFARSKNNGKQIKVGLLLGCSIEEAWDRARYALRNKQAPARKEETKYGAIEPHEWAERLAKMYANLLLTGPSKDHILNGFPVLVELWTEEECKKVAKGFDVLASHSKVIARSLRDAKTDADAVRESFKLLGYSGNKGVCVSSVAHLSASGRGK